MTPSRLANRFRSCHSLLTSWLKRVSTLLSAICIMAQHMFVKKQPTSCLELAVILKVLLTYFRF